MNEYFKGTLVRAKCTLADPNSGYALTDPDVLSVAVTDPADASTVYVYGTDPEVVKDSTGKFHIDISGSAVGVWKHYWTATGSVQGANRGQFKIIDPA